MIRREEGELWRTKMPRALKAPERMIQKRPEAGALIPRRSSYFRLERVLCREARLSEHLLEGYSALEVITWKMCKMPFGSLKSSRARLRGRGSLEDI